MYNMEEDVIVLLAATVGAIIAIVSALIVRSRKKSEKDKTKDT